VHEYPFRYATMRVFESPMKPLPMPIRVAAGLVATALEEAQELPRKLTELPVTAVSRALQTSMRLQQRVTELAIKGDRALEVLRPAPETPSWARFDEDEEPTPSNGRPDRPRPVGVDAAAPARVTPVRILPDPEPERAPEPDGPPSAPEYESWSLPQLRGRFRRLSVEQLEELLAWETAHRDRPPFVTMLSNRIASVSGR
jgi:hypothetical protein